jgi:integrase
MEIFHFIILLNEIAINSDFTGTIPGTSLTLYLQNVPNGTLNIKKMKITLYLRKSKVAEETATICIRIRDGKTDFRTATPFIVNSQYWDNTKLAYKASTPDSVISKNDRKEFNTRIAKLVNLIDERYTDGNDSKWLKELIEEFAQSDIDNPVESQAEPITKTKNKAITLLGAFELYFTEHKFGDRHRSVTSTIYRKLARYIDFQRVIIGDSDFEIYIEDITPDTLNEIRDYITKEHELYQLYPDFYKNHSLKPHSSLPVCPNVLTATMARITFIFNWCVKQGYMKNMRYKSFDHGVLVYGSPYYLTLEERDKIYNADLTGWPVRLINHRDKFVFQCLVGCRYGDLKSFTKDNIVNGFLEYIPQKTKSKGYGGVVRVPLNEKARTILARQNPRDNELFTYHCRQEYNNDIRLLLQLLGINRVVTIINRHTHQEEQHPMYELASSHLARRTFIGNLYKQVQDPNLIGALSGHAPNSKAFERYRTIDEDMKRELINKIN